MVSGKHSIFTHFTNDRNCNICLRTKITRASCRRRIEYSRARSENCWLILKLLITKFLVDSVNHATNIYTLQWYKTRPHNGSSHIRTKQKLLRKHKGAYKSSWSRQGNQKSLTLTIPWNVAKPAKISPGIIVRRHHADRKQMRLLKEQCAE